MAVRFWRDGRAVGGDRVVAAMTVHLAGLSFFLDVGQFATRGKLAIPADYTPASECPKPQEPHQTHGSDPPHSGAIVVPVEVQVCAGDIGPSRSHGILENGARTRAHRRVPKPAVCHRGTCVSRLDRYSKSQIPRSTPQSKRGARPVTNWGLGFGAWDLGFGNGWRETFPAPRRVGAPPRRGREQF